MKNCILLLVALYLVSSCSVFRHVPEYRDIHTGIKDKNGREVVMMDRNIGARSVGDAGRYFTWKRAQKVCPVGYHLMTYSEVIAIGHEDNSNVASKFTDKPLCFPLAGYKPRMICWFRSVENHLTNGCYHLADFMVEEPWYLALDVEKRFYLLNQNYERKLKDRLSVRCVKD